MLFIRSISSRRSIGLGLSCLVLLTMATAFSLILPVVRSAGSEPKAEVILRTATDSVMRLSIITNDIKYNPADHMIYASRPSNAGPNGNSISRINPLNGETVASVYVGSEPNRLALSDNGQTLYTTLDGAFAIRRYDTTTHTPGIQFPIGRGQSVNANDAPYLASDIAVVPGFPDMLTVARIKPGISPPGAGVAVYNNGVLLPNTGPGHSDGANYLAFSASPQRLYGGGYDTGLRTMNVDTNGVTDITVTQTPFYVRNLKHENDLLFEATGKVIDAETRTLLGTCPGITQTDAFVPDMANSRVLYAMKEPASQNVTIKACSITNFTQIGTLTIPGVGSDLSISNLVRYGTNGLAMRTSNNQIYFIQTSLLPTQNPLPAPTGTPANTPTPTPTVYAKFIRPVALPVKDLILRRSDGKFYASIPTTGPAPRANTVTRIDPATGAHEIALSAGTSPGRLAFSADEQVLYVGIDSTNSVRKVDMQTLTPGLQFPLGVGVNGPKIAYDMAVLPNNPNSVAVSYGSSSYNYDGVDIYDEGVKRAQKANASGSLEFLTPDTLYIGEYYLYKYGVSPIGLTLQGNFSTNNSLEAEIRDGLLYGSGSGSVIDLATTEFRGTFKGLGNRSVMTVDAANNRAFFLSQGDGFGGNEWAIRAYRLDNYLPVGTISLPGLPISPDQRRLFRWGGNGLAFTDGHTNVYFVQSDLVSPVGLVPSAIQLSRQTYENNEGNGTLPVTVVRSGGLTGTSTINYATANGTAIAGIDYTATVGTLTFAPGESSKIIGIPIINDNIYEGSETLSITLSNPAGDGIVELFSPSTAALTILDNDGQPFVSAGNVTVNEPRISGTATAVFTLQLSNPSVQTATISYATTNGTATAGSDYIAASGTLTFSPLETVKTISVQILADQIYNEPNETFRINLTNPVNTWTSTPQLTGTIVNYDPRSVRHVRVDFDGDEKTDMSIYRPAGVSGSEWWWLKSGSGGNAAVQFGLPTDRPVPVDYTGDGKTDVAFWRPATGEWFVLRSEDFSFFAFPFGSDGDVPVPDDYDGDGKGDAAVFRESSLTWYISKSSGGTDIVGFGAAGDKPVNADYDGDGKSDIAIFRPSGTNGSEWWVRRSSNASVFALQFGTATDKAAPGDFTGDGKADVAFWRPSTGFWNILRSEDFSYYAFPFGADGDVASPGDYDGDGRFDAAVFRPLTATWFANRSSAGTLIQQFGIAGDVPLPSVYVR